jgi:hypothetical protein
VDELDIWRAAEQMRKLHGADGAIHSAMRADKFLDQGDTAGFEAWRRIVAAVNELDRVTARDGEARH